MKPKGIGFLEQHAEKLVFGVFLAVFLVVILLQFLAPARVTVAGEERAPSAAPDIIERQAQRVRGAIDDAAERQVPTVVTPGYADQLASKLRGEIVEPSYLRALAGGKDPAQGGPTIAQNNDDDTPDQSISYIVPEIPAPDSAIAQIYGGAIDPLAVAQRPELKPLLPAEQPYDKHFVSVEAVLDTTPLREQVAAVPDAENLAPLTREMRSTLELVGVSLIRQRLGSAGNWEEQTVIATLPGRFNLEQTLGDDPSPADSERILQAEASQRNQIRRTPHFPILMGETWLRPARKAALSADLDPDLRAEVDRLVRRIRSLDGAIARLERRLEEPRQDPRDDRGDDDRRGSAESPSDPIEVSPDYIPGRWPTIPDTWHAQGGGPGGGGGGGGGGGDDDRDDRQRERLLERLEELRQQRDDTLERLTELGFNPDGSRIESDITDDYTPQNLPLLNETAEPIRLWAHDYTAQPGETYRYALRVETVNPLFVFQERLSDEQQATVESFTLQSPPSDFTGPVTIPRRTRTFLVDASPAGVSPIGRPESASADFEVFHFYYGMWHRTSATLSPGDRFSATVDLPAGLETFDITNPAEPQEAQVAGREPIENQTLEIAAPLMLIDVIRDAISATASELAIIRDANGQLADRRPAEADDDPNLARFLTIENRRSEVTVPEPVGDTLEDRRRAPEDDRRGPRGGGGGPEPPDGPRGPRGGGGGGGR